MKDRAVGVIAVDNKTRRGPIGDEQVNLLGIFANQAAVAVDNARLYEQLRQKIAELDSRVDQLSILHQIGNSMQRDITRQEALGFILRGVLEGIGFSQVAVALVDREEGALRGELGLGLDNAVVRAVRVPLTDERNLLVMAATRKSPVGIVHFARTGLDELIGAPLEDGSWRESVGSEVPEARAAIVAVPLIAREEVVGVIVRRAHRAGAHPPPRDRAAAALREHRRPHRRAGGTLRAHAHRAWKASRSRTTSRRLFTLRHGQQKARGTRQVRRDRPPLRGTPDRHRRLKEYNERCGHDLGDNSLAEIGGHGQDRPCGAATSRSATAAA